MCVAAWELIDLDPPIAEDEDGYQLLSADMKNLRNFPPHFLSVSPLMTQEARKHPASGMKIKK